MGLIVKDSGDFQIAPAGQHRAVCVDVVDLGNVVVEWAGKKKTQHKCRLVWEIEERMADGRSFVVGRRFTASLGEKAALRAFLEMWRGKPFTADELAGFDTETLIGIGAIVQIVHEKKGDKTYDNINVIMKPMKGTAHLAPTGKYVRVKDRPTAEASALPGSAAPTDDDFPPPIDDDDLPF